MTEWSKELKFKISIVALLFIVQFYLLVKDIKTHDNIFLKQDILICLGIVIFGIITYHLDMNGYKNVTRVVFAIPLLYYLPFALFFLGWMYDSMRASKVEDDQRPA
jgi:hypothetical protein